MSTKDRIAEWAANHQLSVIVGSWALTMGIVGNKVMRDPYVFSLKNGLCCAELTVLRQIDVYAKQGMISWLCVAWGTLLLCSNCHDIIACSSASLGSGAYHWCCHRYSRVDTFSAGTSCKDEDGKLSLSSYRCY